MLRKLLALGALVVVGVAFGAGSATANPGNGNGNGPSQSAWDHASGKKFNPDGFSDGRLGN